jgi:LSD1 subclass zinc finger protein
VEKDMAKAFEHTKRVRAWGSVAWRGVRAWRGVCVNRREEQNKMLAVVVVEAVRVGGQAGWLLGWADYSATTTVSKTHTGERACVVVVEPAVAVVCACRDESTSTTRQLFWGSGAVDVRCAVCVVVPPLLFVRGGTAVFVSFPATPCVLCFT